MNRRKAPLLLALALLFAGAALLVYRTRPEPGPASEAASARASAPATDTPGAQALAARNRGTPAAGEQEALERPGEDLVAWLRSRYGGRLHEPHTQVRMLEQLMRHFQKLNPTGWEADLLAVLRQAFPELYEELAPRLRQRLDYEKWMKEHHAALQEMPAAERRAAVWEERNRLFGEEVAGKLWAAELRNLAVADALAAIDALPGASIDDRMAKYKQGLQRAHGEQAQTYLQVHQQELMNRFLDLGSVQTDLGAMLPGQRAESLRTIRQEMGLDEQALARWEELDRMRDTRWELGSQYMSEREALAREYAGPELEARLTELRARYFSDEAQTIAEEEHGGFFRYTRPRQWGRN